MAFTLDNVPELLIYQQRHQKTQDRRFVMHNGPKLAAVANACRNMNLNPGTAFGSSKQIGGLSHFCTSLFTKQVAK